MTALSVLRLKMTIGICPPPSGPTPVAKEMRSLRWYQDRILKDEKLLPSLFEELQGKMLGAWDADSPNSHSQVLIKLLTNISPIMTLPTFFARFVSCKSLLSNFYKHDFWFRGKFFDCVHRAYQYHWAILLKKDKVAKSIMNASSAYHTAK